LRQLKKPQTVPSRLRLPSENVWVKLIEHVTGVFGFVIAFVSRKLCVVPPNENVNIKSNTVGWKIALLPTTCAGANGAVFWFCAPAP
jgi:hypothetical protein